MVRELSDLKRLSFDVVIIGSGPAGIAVAERIYEKSPSTTIAIVERGPVLLRQHFYHSRGSIHERDRFLERHGYCPWDGDLSEGGTLLPCLGGRGIVGGSQLHRFYDDDYALWPDGQWGVGAAELSSHFLDAEKRLLGPTRSVGDSQDLACNLLSEFDAQHPPSRLGASPPRGPAEGFPHRSSVERILGLLDKDRIGKERRLSVLTETVAVGLQTAQSPRDRVTHVRCINFSQSRRSLTTIYATAFVIAASPVESARLVFLSDLGECRSNSSLVGRYLSEHIYLRGYLETARETEIGRGTVNLFIPPLGHKLDDRYQIELRSTPHPDRSRVLFRMTGSAAMDPNIENRVLLSANQTDSRGVRRASTILRRSQLDEQRTQSMLTAMNDVASSLGVGWFTPPKPLPLGASYHEAGTLRVASTERESAAAPDGRLLGTQNVFVGDGAAFASVGTANPILTLTAMGYRLADNLISKLK